MANTRGRKASRPVYTVILKTGRKLRGQVQGSGGAVADASRLRQVIRGRLQEEQTGKTRGGSRIAKKFAGNVSVWTNPDAIPSKRLTTVKASQIREVIAANGTQVYNWKNYTKSGGVSAAGLARWKRTGQLAKQPLGARSKQLTLGGMPPKKTCRNRNKVSGRFQKSKSNRTKRSCFIPTNR